MKYKIIIFIVPLVFSLTGCAALKFTGQTLNTVGKVVVATVETAGKVVVTTGKVLVTVIQMPFGKQVVKLTKRGNSLLLDVLLNKKIKAKFLLDTGCMDTQISTDLARRIGIRDNEGERITASLAGGYTVGARAVIVKELKVGSARVLNLTAIVLDNDSSEGYDGLLGMAFLNNFIFKIDSVKGELILEKRKKA